MTAQAPSTLRAFRWPRAWLALWASMIAAVIVLSLIPKPPIPQALMIGKFDHLIAYAALAVMAVQLYARRRAQWSAALAIIALGIALELAQGFLTTYRHMELYDALVDAFGAALGLATAWTPCASWLQRIEARVLR